MLSHDISNVLCCLDIRDHDDLPLYALLKKTNLDCHMLHSLVSCVKSFPVATAIAAVLSTQTQVLLIIVSCSCVH